MNQPQKALGQHWLFDEPTLAVMVKAAQISPGDVVLEIGPGLGTLTALLARAAKRVVAIEKDPALARDLASTVPASNLEVIEGDILRYDLSRLPPGYKLVANIPYYLTSQLLRRLLEDKNPPEAAALMVQKEVAQRIVASPGQMSLLSLSVQYYASAKLIAVVPKELFTPPPKVDSAILRLKRRSQPVFQADTKLLFRLWKAGFAGKRKQLKNSLSAGLHITSPAAEQLLLRAGIDPQKRAQDLSLEDWHRVYIAMAPQFD